MVGLDSVSELTKEPASMKAAHWAWRGARPSSCPCLKRLPWFQGAIQKGGQRQSNSKSWSSLWSGVLVAHQ